MTKTIPASLLEALRQRRRFSWLPKADRRGTIALERRLRARQTTQRRKESS